MKKILHKLRLWLLKLLGGVPCEIFNDTCCGALEKIEEAVKMLHKRANIIHNYSAAVQNICHKDKRPDGTDTYYDWCCDYCVGSTDCKRNGWCESFTPKDQDKCTDKKLPPQK